MAKVGKLRIIEGNSDVLVRVNVSFDALRIGEELRMPFTPRTQGLVLKGMLTVLGEVHDGTGSGGPTGDPEGSAQGSTGGPDSGSEAGEEPGEGAGPG